MRKIYRLKKRERQIKLSERLHENPFLTDEELAERYSVSVQTIRLDRLELGIPELRERIKNVAEQKLEQVKPLQRYDITGELVDLKLDQSAVSILEISEEHLVSHTLFAKDHYVFAQANSLAVAVVNAQVAQTGAARIRFIRPVKLKERLIARAIARSQQKDKTIVRIETRVQDELVFSGSFHVYKVMDTHKA
ncbi:fatty acid biosynthesis transcriptional regulator [Ammoniphilus oxalaticus]|uniref:Fatty acid biosynthesis transcriptional regulator n=1 Tax=Ammoniphilus oxalaticus TaxID=66863 RepID=A0A419SL19_9BACL|nr:transcription factor FapR [Ammoniphilus oxalaticus]RKD24682.1 fatty acid biosynthesis transcriptional regulator [Ammoniphilus oxalaticus]